MSRSLKLFTIIVSISSIFLLTGCNNNDAFSSDSYNSNMKLVVGFSQIGAESDWRTANTQSIKDSCEKAGYELIFSDAQQKQENQIAALRSFIAQRVDFILLAPVVETGWDTVLQEIHTAKIPLILVDRTIKLSKSKTNLWITRVGENFYKEGFGLAKWVKNNSDNLGFKNKKTVNVFELVGTSGSGAAIDREKAWEDVMKDTKFITIKKQAADFTRAKGQEVMEAWLKSYKGKIDLVFSQNDDMALGAISAIEAAGLKPGKDIKIVSIDGVKSAFEAMAAGKLNCVAECSPLTGPELVKAISRYRSGEKIEKETYSKEGIFPANIAKASLPSRKY